MSHVIYITECLTTGLVCLSVTINLFASYFVNSQPQVDTPVQDSLADAARTAEKTVQNVSPFFQQSRFYMMCSSYQMQLNVPVAHKSLVHL